MVYHKMKLLLTIIYIYIYTPDKKNPITYYKISHINISSLLIIHILMNFTHIVRVTTQTVVSFVKLGFKYAFPNDLQLHKCQYVILPLS